MRTRNELDLNPILVISDLHGDSIGKTLVEKAILKFNPSEIFSSGDQCPEPYDPFYSKLTMVRGNSDRLYSYIDLPFPPLFIEREVFNHKVIMTHGDRYSSSDFDLNKGTIFISGHTHVPKLKKDNNIIYLNPGSPSYPRSSSGPSAALIFPSFIALLDLIDLSFRSKLNF